MRYKLIDNSLNDMSNVLTTVLLNRGVSDVRTYMRLSDSCIEDYNNLENIHEAVECFKKHFDADNDITILVDCDPDGYTSAAMIYSYIKTQKPDYPVSYLIHRNNKAHGLAKMNSGDFEIPQGTKLLIIPDAGTNVT